mmetsp:Transcript_15172/g.22817  ORF Transcript_15172/g.22817 Transcript_15172/m.22817 type:complete len:148 (-) Transcript_15172:239-682(-)|eukprot:CAMPEP_0185019576 /NCGR_PEP_ID=MMETSP1103-20130426/2201_1 /TAXON_ID=36769 /ORGANISM="Paraphysomonas bandaiensis, Strain Caron Lab Isolate" /LENGTH=147 /DNA_ID=CAMNT_0027549977 /DNA_START=152 /DNA_END=595 /DNA_ORIENTATION=-
MSSMFANSSALMGEIYVEIRLFLAAYGWYLVFLIIALYLLKPYLVKWREERAYRAAQNPLRVKILDEERKRVRLRQQLEILKASEAAAKEKAASDTDVPKKPKSVAKPSPKPSMPTSHGYNPMAGGGHISTFKPSGGGMRSRGRRRG